MTESRVRGLYANATAWNFGDHDDRPDLARMRDNAYYEFDRFVNKVKADALREAAKIMRVSGMPIYEQESGSQHDLNGNDGQAIDTWYASHLEERADRIEGEA